MAYPAAAGHPQHSGIMIPEVWSGKILAKFYDSTVFNMIANTDYEGEIKSQGDTVHIRNTPSIVIRDHTKGQKLNYETPEPEIIDLNIDKGKYWAFNSDDVDKHQSDYNYVEDWTRDAAEQLKINIDTNILADVYSDAHASNKGLTAGVNSSSINLGTTGTPFQLTKANIVDKIIDMGTVFDEQNVPETGRSVVLPPWACAMIKGSDLKEFGIKGHGVTDMLNRLLISVMTDKFPMDKDVLLEMVRRGLVK